MIQEDLWIARLAEEAHVAYETSECLWDKLVAELGLRLSSGEVLNMAYAGYWHLELESEGYTLVEGVEYLLPPCLRLRISAVAPESLPCVKLVDMSVGLELATAVRPQHIVAWLEAIPKVLEAQTKGGRRLATAGLGVFSPREGGGFVLELAESFAEYLNKPFAMFSPAPLSAGMDKEDLAYLDLKSLEELKTYIITYEYSPLPELKEVEPISEEVEAKEEVLADVSPKIEPVGEDRSDVWASSEELNEEPTKGGEGLKKVGKRKLGFLGLCLGVFVLVFYWGFCVRKGRARVSEQIEATSSIPTDQVKDSSSTEDTSLAMDEVSNYTPSVSNAEYSHKVGLQAEPEEIILKAGASLMRIAKEKYGHKVFWVYIYEENRDRLRDPNNIPLGVRITLPAASKYGIDPDNNNSLEEALLLQDRILNKTRSIKYR